MTGAPDADAPADASGAPWTIGRLLDWTTSHFERQGIESPRLCAELLLAHALGCPRIHLYTRYDAAPDPDALARYRESVRRAAAHEPVAYLTGVKEFFSLPLRVTRDVLIPRPETEVLVERTIALARRAPGAARTILDLGCGSGCIAVSLARHLPDSRLFASDVSDAALAVARDNAERCGVSGRIEFRGGDLLAPWAGSRFDVIVSNPPYVATTEAADLPPEVREHEPAVALFAGDDGLAVHRRIAADAAAHLEGGGHLLLEVSWTQAPAVRGLLDAAGFRDIVTYRDELRHERVVHARR